MREAINICFAYYEFIALITLLRKDAETPRLLVLFIGPTNKAHFRFLKPILSLIQKY